MATALGAGIDFLERQKRARQILEAQNLDLLLSTPGTNFRYLTGVNAHRMERFTAFVLPRTGSPFLICPAFEEDNMRRDIQDAEIFTWGESDDPFALLARVLAARPAATSIGLEPTTWFWMSERIRECLPSWRLLDAGDAFDRLRSRKAAGELAAMKRSGDVAEEVACKARFLLKEGMTELEASEVLKDIARRSGAELDVAIVQFGANSAIPHASPGSRTLKRNDMVLFDLCPCLDGYFSDITRMTCFGDATNEMKDVYRIVYEAQQAAIAAARPGVPCQDVDRAARKVITRAGFGDYFLHRTGHGLGMDIHEGPYLVEGNEQPLEVGNVVTIEPGIYLPGRFGVRIEDDVLVTAGGPEVLTDGQPALIETP
jgi:Xaa-Pro dipeptidase